ncbi:MAG TPA: IS630 family transposase [Candidatus Sulfotelmatobacter sp.]|nr:IS630 family transposase [Candidatus Sulfotelmatobacter sp.]
MPSAAGGPRVFPPLQRVQIERMACTHPSAYGRPLSRWDVRSLQQEVVAQAIVADIHYTTVARFLVDASLHPHRCRYWKTTRVDEAFIRLAAQVLWCYEQAQWLHRKGELVICVDEKPNIQALSRTAPTQPIRPGQLLRREFEYKRHGTANLIVAFNVHNGRMWADTLEANDHLCFLDALCDIAKHWKWAKRLHLILDNGPSHIDQQTRHFLEVHPRFRAVYTPTHASWLNQAELLLRAFTDKYLKFFDAPSRQMLVDHLHASWPDYNCHYAHPFEWSWSRSKMHAWAEKKQTLICSKTFATEH